MTGITLTDLVYALIDKIAEGYGSMEIVTIGRTNDNKYTFNSDTFTEEFTIPCFKADLDK